MRSEVSDGSSAATRRSTSETSAVPSGPVQLSGAKAAALAEVNAALDNMQQAQTGGNFAEFGEALQRLDDAMNKYSEAK